MVSMGMFLSKVSGSVTRSVRNYNVEERAMKVISQDKPVPAPSYPSVQKIKDELIKDPDKLVKDQPDKSTMDILNKVYITSSGQNPSIQTQKKLPVERIHHESMYGYIEPAKIPEGKATLQQIIKFLTEHRADSHYNASKIAMTYNLEENKVKNILDYYSPFHVIIREKGKPTAEKSPLKRLRDGIDRVKE